MEEKSVYVDVYRLGVWPTSGSVRQRPMAMMPDAKMPSVQMGPTKVCMFGVKRKGTTSLVAKTGN